MYSKTFRLMALVIVSLSFALGVSAQATGSLTGTVKDPNGAVVQGVTVTVKNKATNQDRTVVSNSDGRWTLQVLPVGRYSVSYEKVGFSTGISEDIEVEASVPRIVDVTLQIGQIENVITVTTDLPLVQTESAAISRQITGDEVTRVPTSTRSFTGLLSSIAGVSSELSPVGVNGNGNISPSVNGTRTTSTSLFFNGIDATNITSSEGSLTDNISPAPETLQEVKLQTSMYDASTGRSGGGNFQLVTKSGANKAFGTVYYYLQNKAFNSNEFFFEDAGIEKPVATRYEGGFTVGGPIRKDKIFFFGGYQYTKANTGLVPTARSRTILPQAMTVLGTNRSKDAIAAAFNQFNGCAGSNCLVAGDISDVAFKIFNLKNPVTGGFILPSVSNFRALGIVDQSGTGSFQFGNFPSITSRTIQRNNPLIEVISVEPARFEQNQFTAKIDAQLTPKNTMSGTFFFSNFPGYDPFPDPSSLASPFTLLRNDRNRSLAVSNTHLFDSNLVNELRFGLFYLNNTRRLDDPFLAITNESIGVFNPASTFDTSNATTRLGHYIGRNNIANFSFGGPNDSFNRRKQITFSVADNMTWTRGNAIFKFGAEYKRHRYDTDLPEEQATEFEKFDSFTQLLTGNATEADTQYGITDKSFRMQDYGLYFTTDWKLSQRLTVNLGVRYEVFRLPTEKNGRIGNFDLEPYQKCFTKTGGTNAFCDSPAPGFLIPRNVRPTGNAVVDGAVRATNLATNNHTLKGDDWNNIAPRVGVAYQLSDKFVFRGGYGMFYDRPSAAFINTVFSNYPFLREVEITVPSGNVSIPTAFSGVPTTLPLNQWLPFRIVRAAGTSGAYQIRDNTPVYVDSRGVPQGSGCDPATGINCIRGNIAETFEFRAIDRNLRTPMIHQWNAGFQYEFAKGLLLETRYVGTAGRKLLQVTALNQGFDLNDPNTPDHIFERFNQAYVAAGAPNGALNSGATARDRGLGKAFGFFNSVTGQVDLNLSNSGGAVINFEARVPILGFNVPEALLLKSDAYSNYHGLQFDLTKRLSGGLQLNASYTFSKSIDIMSSDPGSTAGSGKPDVPNSGFIAQGDARNTGANKAVSDFDRPHRFSASFVYEIPTGGSSNRLTKGWQVSGFFQAQSGTPFTVFASEPEVSNASQYSSLTRGSGGLVRPGFGRPNVVCSANDAIGKASKTNLNVINTSCFASPLGQFGNLGRNTFRGPSQNRVDLSFAKTTQLTENVAFEVGFDLFNVMNKVNFANPNSDLQDAVDFGAITNTIGGPRVGQFRAKLRF